MFDSYKEVFQQGDVLRKTYEYLNEKRNEIGNFWRSHNFEEIVFLGCGSSYWLSLSAAVTMEKQTGVRCQAVKSGEVFLHPDLFRGKYRNPLVIAPSRSGTTEETLFAIDLFRKEYGCQVLALVEYPDAPIEHVADYTLFLPWANEISVCQTRSFSSLYLSSVMLAAFAGGDEKLLAQIKEYLDRFDVLSADAEQKLKAMIKEFSECRSLVTLGCGAQYGVTIEGAYIGVEMAQFPANYYSLLEFRHGPIVMADTSYLVAFFTRTDARREEEQMAADSKRHGAKILAIVDEGAFAGADYEFCYGMKTSDEVLALYGIMVMQGFAHLKAVDLGIDPDHPKDLVPFITLK